MKLGEQQVQGLDYAYTIQGWLKGVNSTSLDAKKDMGQDGLAGSENSQVAKDEFGYSLSYFDGDYSAINAPQSDLDVQVGNNLYNGNIRNMTTSIRKFMQGGTGATQTMAYQYDQLNRIKESQAYDNQDGQLTAKEDYKTKYSYDANGNLLSLHRNATTAEGRKLMMDELEYVYETKENGYKRNTNKLRQVRDAVAASNYSDDIDSQQKDNYAYDEIGNLVEDKQEDITKIDWTVYGKVQKVNKADRSIIEFRYDAAGNRIAKRFKNQAEDRTTHYVRDASGNMMAIYEQSGSSFKLIEQPIYGSDMLGERKVALEMTGSNSKESSMFAHSVGLKAFYLKNHLSNHLAAVSDRKDAAGNAVVLSATDYYAFGAAMPGRGSNSSDLRFGFNGFEKENEIAGSERVYTTSWRPYNAQLGRWWATDPKQAKYPSYSPYGFALNNPTVLQDPAGDTVRITVTNSMVGFTQIKLYSGGEIAADQSRENMKTWVPVYEVQVANESGQSATYYFTRYAERAIVGTGQDEDPVEDVSFDIRQDNESFAGVIKSRWQGTNNVLELRPPNWADLSVDDMQTIEGMKSFMYADRTAIQMHALGASDGCLMCALPTNIVRPFGGTLNATGSGSQTSFMNTLMNFRDQDTENGFSEYINISFERVNMYQNGSQDATRLGQWRNMINHSENNQTENQDDD